MKPAAWRLIALRLWNDVSVFVEPAQAIRVNIQHSYIAASSIKAEQWRIS
jgi:hypothetical protein